MRAFLKGLFVFVCGFVGFVLWALPGLLTNVEYPDVLFIGLFVSPIIGSMLAAWLVSLRSERKAAWILGGGIGLGVLALLVILGLMAAVLFSISSSIST